MRGRPYPAEVRERATRMVTERVPDSPSPWAAIESVASHLGLHPNTVRLWYRQAQGVADERPLLPSEQIAEIARLRKELADARRLNAEFVAGTGEPFHHTERTPL